MALERTNSTASSSSNVSTSGNADGGPNSSSNSRVGVVVLEREVGDYALILRGPKDEAAARVVRVCGATGSLVVGEGINGMDAFGDVESACAGLRARGYATEKTRGARALGYATFGDVSALLIAKTTRVGATLPTGDVVHVVKESEWIRIPLRNACVRLSREERVNLQTLCEFSIDGTHFYCESFDVSRPFAYGESVDSSREPDDEWVWNAALSAPLRATNVSGACPVLIQGLVEHRELCDLKGKPFQLCVFGKRSSLHPGTRYLARGLNELGAPGNEVEMEQIVWCDASDGQSPEADEGTSEAVTAAGAHECSNQSIKWSSYVWRRGSVPISWTQEIKQAYGEAEIQVSKENPYRGTATYFTRLMDAYADGEHTETELPVTCVNLLRCAPGKPELLLSEHFHEAVRGLRQNNRLGAVSVLNFDWHANCKALGESKTVEGLWAALRQQLLDDSIFVGTCQTGAEKAVNERQHGVLRYNCADSLDRTNLAGFFVAVQVLTEQCSSLGVDVFNAEANAGLAYGSTSRMGSSDLSRTASGSELPPGWESRKDTTTGRTFYIDHNTRTTSWTLPEFDIGRSEVPTVDVPTSKSPDTSPGQSKLLSRLNSGQMLNQSGGAEWLGEIMTNGKPEDDTSSFKWLGSTVDEFRAALLPQCLATMVEIFLANGDFHAQMYTSTRASHTQTLHLLDANPATAASVRFKSTPSTASSTMSNAALGIQRRFHNMVSDRAKQSQFEMFLGLNQMKYFPSIKSLTQRSLVFDECVTLEKESACVQPKIEEDLLECMLAPCGATSAVKSPLWISARDDEHFTVEFKTPQASHRAEYLLLTTAGGVNEFSAPSLVEVTIAYYNSSRADVRTLVIPRVEPGTCLSYSLSELGTPVDGDAWNFSTQELSARERIKYIKVCCTRNHFATSDSKSLLAIGHIEIIASSQLSGDEVGVADSPLNTETLVVPEASVANYESALDAVSRDSEDELLASLLELELTRLRANIPASDRDKIIQKSGPRENGDYAPTSLLKKWQARSQLRDLTAERSRTAASTTVGASAAISSLRSLTESLMAPMVRPNSATLSSVSSALNSQVAANSAAVSAARSPRDERILRAIGELIEITQQTAYPPSRSREVIFCAQSRYERHVRAEASAALRTFLDDDLVRTLINDAPDIRREYMRALFEHCSLDGLSLHVGVPSSVVVGFRLLAPDPISNYKACTLRVTAVCEETDDFTHVADYVVPATKPRTTLHYEFGQVFADIQPKSLLFHLYLAADRPSAALPRTSVASNSTAWSLHGRVTLYAHALVPKNQH